MNDNTINESSKTEDTDNENDEIRAVRNSLEKDLMVWCDRLYQMP